MLNLAGAEVPGLAGPDDGQPFGPERVELSDRQPHVVHAVAALADEVPRLVRVHPAGAVGYRVVGAVEVGRFIRLHTCGVLTLPSLAQAPGVERAGARCPRPT